MAVNVYIDRLISFYIWFSSIRQYSFTALKTTNRVQGYASKRSSKKDKEKLSQEKYFPLKITNG